MLLHIFLAVAFVVALMAYGLALLARHRGGLFRIQYGSDFHKGYRHQ